MLTKASWVYRSRWCPLLGVVLCTGMLSCSYGCTPLLRGCVGIPGTSIGVLADYENVGNGSVDAAQVNDIELDWAAGRVVFEEYDVAYDGGESIENRSFGGELFGFGRRRVQDALGGVERGAEDRRTARRAAASSAAPRSIGPTRR